MNIHEHQAKDILKEFGAPVSKGVVIFSENEIKDKIKYLQGEEFVVKVQIHAGGRGKAGGVKIVKGVENLLKETKDMLGKTLVTKQTGPNGKGKEFTLKKPPKFQENYIYRVLWIEFLQRYIHK